MSYKRTFDENTDTLSMLFSIMNDCILSCKQMLLCKDEPMSFIRWYDKAKQTDERTTYFFLKKNWNDIGDKCKALCRPFVEKYDRRIENTGQRLLSRKEQ